MPHLASIEEGIQSAINIWAYKSSTEEHTKMALNIGTLVHEIKKLPYQNKCTFSTTQLTIFKTKYE